MIYYVSLKAKIVHNANEPPKYPIIASFTDNLSFCYRFPFNEAIFDTGCGKGTWLIFFCKLDKNTKPLFALSFHFETLNLMAIREFWPFLKESLILLLEQLLEPVSYSREALRNSENYWIVSWFISTFANYTWSLRLRLSRQTCTYNFTSNGSGTISRWTILMCRKNFF